jgi:putative ABC transport system ATP-binding protein
MKAALADSGFLNTVYRIGLDYQIGSHGRLLFPRQRAAVDLARCLVKNPAILVLDDTLRAFPAMEAKAILQRLTKEFESRLLITALPSLDDAMNVDLKITFDKGRVVGIEKGDEARSTVAGASSAASAETRERTLQGTQPESLAAEQDDESAIQAQVAE